MLDERDRGLFSAVISVAAGLELHATLLRIVQSAADLVRARYAALGVLGPHGIEQFIHVGMDETTVATLPHPPVGQGVLGLLITDPQPLRIEDLSRHPQAVGFPSGHPPMRTFLGVPVLIRGAVFGNLYLTQKEGGAQFTVEDERTVTTLAAAAAAAIENARMFERSRRRELWQEMVTQMGNVVLSGGSAREAAQVLADNSFTLLEADTAVVLLRDEHDEHDEGHERHERHERHEHSFIAVSSTRGPARPVDQGEANAAVHSIEIPLLARERTVGVLRLTRAAAAAPFQESDLELAQPFFEQAALTLVLAEIQREQKRLAVFEDRDRIARDLHDLVIQRLFATGMLLQGSLRTLNDAAAPGAANRVSTAIDQLDITVKEIRQTIFALQEPMDGPAIALRGRVMQEVSQAAQAWGLAPTVRFTGPIDSLVTAQIGEQAVATLREALTNVGKHAQATRVEVAVSVVEHELVITVSDDGVGFDPGVRTSGLTNLQARAVGLGGGFDVESMAGAPGTTVRWHIPLDEQD